MCSSEERLTFEMCKKNFEKAQLPSDRWCHLADYENFVGFVKLEEDFNIKRKVIVMEDLSTKIFFNEKLYPLSEFMHLKNISELLNLLQIVDKMEL